jgi:hypothetical protein
MEEKEQAVDLKKSILYRRISTAIVFVLIYVTLFIFFKPGLLFSQTTTSGGDMGSHNYLAKFMIEELLPRFRVTGWTMNWYAGLPMLTFYFPLPYLIMAFLSLIIPYTVSFKLATVAGVFLLPLSAYIYGKLLRFRSPFPELAAVMATAFLFMESYSIYGGNIPSILAGEFGYSLSFALVFIFMGTLYRGMEQGRYDWLFIINSLILTALVLSHLITTIALILMIPGLLILNRQKRAILYIIAVFAIGLLLTSFWGIPFLDKLSWTTNMGWQKLTALKDIFPSEIWPYAAIAIFGIIYSFRKKVLNTLPLFWSTFILVIVFFSLEDGRLWNARLLPFIFFSIFLWAAYGLFSLSSVIVYILKVYFAVPTGFTRRFIGIIVAAIVGIVLIFSSPMVMSWIRWNYSGYETKPDWPQYKQINDYIGKLPEGRFMFEHDNDRIGKFGTPRAFELIPYWTDKPVMEGLLVEGSFTSPYHFINQAELSPKPGSGISGIDFPALNIPLGITHLQLMNVRYFMASSPEVVDPVSSDPRAKLLTKIGDFSIFEISGNYKYVEVVKNLPVRVSTNDWRSTIIPWYLNESDLSVPVIWDRGEIAITQFKSVNAENVTNPTVEPVKVAGGIISEKIENEKITFETTAIGYPHIIKVSYFPNWRVQGADGPFLISPSFMMVIPRQKDVTLTYGPTASNIAGDIITGIGWLVILALLILNIYKSIAGRRNKYLVK